MDKIRKALREKSTWLINFNRRPILAILKNLTHTEHIIVCSIVPVLTDFREKRSELFFF